MTDQKNDAVGKLFELSIGLNLSNANTFPEDFRAGEDRAPSIYQRLADEVGASMTIDIYEHAREASSHIRTRLIDDGMMANTTDVVSVWWTSQPADHELLTGVKDPNAYCDLTLSSSTSTVGISAKYGSTRTPNLRNSGLDTLETVFSFTVPREHIEAHFEYVADLGFTGSHVAMHHQYKAEKGSERSLAARESSMGVKHSIAEMIQHRIASMDTDVLRERILHFAAPETYLPHYVAHTRTGDRVEHVVYHARDRVVDLLSSYDKLYTTVKPNRATNVSIYGKRSFDGGRDTVASIAIKDKSGPMLGWNSTFNLPALVKRRKKRVLYAFDLDDTLFWQEKDGAASITVRDGEGRLVSRVDTAQYHSYKLKPGEFFDYSELKDSAHFANTSKPIGRMIKKLRKVLEKHRVEIITARADFNDKDLFVNTLHSHGIDTTRIHVRRCGNYGHLPNSKMRKVHQFELLIDEWKYDEIHFYDDVQENLDAFLDMQDRYPDVKFVAYLVKHDPKKDKTVVRKLKR